MFTRILLAGFKERYMERGLDAILNFSDFEYASPYKLYSTIRLEEEIR